MLKYTRLQDKCSINITHVILLLYHANSVMDTNQRQHKWLLPLSAALVVHVAGDEQISSCHCCTRAHYLEAQNLSNDISKTGCAMITLHKVIFRLLTSWKATSKKHIKKVLRGNIGLKVSVMRPLPSGMGSFFSVNIILTSFFRVTKNCISITYSCWRRGYFVKTTYKHSPCRLLKYMNESIPLNASVAPGAWFLSGWNFRANFR